MQPSALSKLNSDDRAVAIYHVILNHEGFEESAQNLFKLIQRTQNVTPGKTRWLFLDIKGHRDSEGNFDNDMLELQNVFIPDVLGRFLAETHCPLYTVTNPKPQENDIPPEPIIQQP